MVSLPFRKVLSDPVWPAEPASFSCRAHNAFSTDVALSCAHAARLRARTGYSLLQNCMAFSYSASAASVA